MRRTAGRQHRSRQHSSRVSSRRQPDSREGGRSRSGAARRRRRVGHGGEYRKSAQPGLGLRSRRYSGSGGCNSRGRRHRQGDLRELLPAGLPQDQAVRTLRGSGGGFRQDFHRLRHRGRDHRRPEAHAQALTTSYSGQSGRRDTHVGCVAGSSRDRRVSVGRHPYRADAGRVQTAHRSRRRDTASMRARQMIKRVMLLIVILVGAWCVMLLSAGSPPADAVNEAPKELVFVPVKIDGPIHDPAKHTFWFGPFAECSSVLDIDGDGKLDIAAGRNYYLAPNWTKHTDYRDGAATNGPDVDDNYEGTMDVNNDGRMDVISSGWMLKQGIFWYENPGKPGVKWQSHTLLQADGLEGMVIGNLSGHGPKDVLVNYFAKKPGRSVIWFEHLDQAPWFKEHTLGPEGVGVVHGAGIGDINGDGRDDVVTPSGWFEAPQRPTEQPWIWHPDYQFAGFGAAPGRPGGAGLPILVYDFNGDGLNDIVMGSDHGYGLAWFEQKMENGKRSFVQHWIETEYPTFHTMALADLDGDG